MSQDVSDQRQSPRERRRFPEGLLALGFVACACTTGVPSGPSAMSPPHARPSLAGRARSRRAGLAHARGLCHHLRERPPQASRSRSGHNGDRPLDRAVNAGLLRAPHRGCAAAGRSAGVSRVQTSATMKKTRTATRLASLSPLERLLRSRWTPTCAGATPWQSAAPIRPLLRAPPC
jgi:hypothetical protein